ncbi:hypothetical protein [uncultured Cohaesibacter sp.]|uniref:hypothetical protein n=1 Tax=uncultured Cohaesibacter sp. TaxID=1002546 RepID=UPI0029C69467|nr:hypothetical protein [uncultured Cohaesibacter sp.]
MTKVTIHGYKNTPAKEDTAIIADITVDLGEGEERVKFVYREGMGGDIASALAKDLQENDPPIYEADPIPEPALLPLTPRQLRLILSRYGYLSQVQPTLEALEDPQVREEALIEWEYATQYEPDNPLIEQLRLALSISEDEMDTMWRTAETL